jgi:hypothetical protein
MLSGTTRRQFLAGGAAVVAGGAAHAGWHRVGFAYLDQARRTQVRLFAFSDQGQVLAKADQRFAWSRETFGPTASFSITHNEKDESSVLTVREASLPGTGTFGITIQCRKSKIGDWELVATVSSFWDNGAPVTARAIPAQAFFVSYLAPSPVATCEIDDGKRTAALLRALFGQRVEAEGGVRLSLDGLGLWSIESAPRAPKPPGRMYALAVPMSFDKIDLFATRTVLETTVAGDAPADGTTAARAASNVRTSSTARGFAGTLLFDEAVIHAPRDQANVRSIEGLYGRIGWRSLRFDGDPAAPKPPVAPRSTATDFVLAARRLANGKTLEARIALDREPAATGAHDTEPPVGHGVAALRHWGDPRYSIAGYVRKGESALRPIGRLSFLNGSAGEAAEGPFAFSELKVTRQLERGTNGQAAFVMTRASATPIAKETLLLTSSGGFEVSALPSVTERPGSGSRVPEISLSARDAAPGRAVGVQERVLERFGAELALSWAGIALPERVGDAGAGVERGTHLTRLSFTGAQAHFYLPLLGPPPRNAAEALIPIGPTVAANDGASVKAELDLSSARLCVSRPRDLLSLTFRFSGLVLQLPWRAPGEAARIVAHGGRSACRARGAGDDRPLLVVDFPPQHVMEQAVFRQLSLPPKLPAYPPELSASAVPHFEILARPKRRTPFDPVGSPAKAPTNSDLRIKARNHLVEIAKNAKSENATAFMNFSEDFAKATAGKGFPREQCIYVGEAFLDPDVRRVAIDVVRRGQGGIAVPLPSAADLYPDVELLPLARAAILRPIVERLRSESENPGLDAAAKAAAGRWLKAVQGNDEDLLPFVAEEKKVAEIYGEIEKAKEASSRRYADFRLRYHTEAAGIANLAEYRGAVWYGTRTGLPDRLKTFMAKEGAAWRAQNEEPTPEVAEARLSGPSRIAFRVNCDDHQPDRAGGTIPFSLEAITDWASFDMAVVRRAERLMQSRPDGSLAPRWERKASIDDGAILRFQGIRPGDHLARAETARDGRSTTGIRQSSRVPVRQRLAEIHAATSEPPNAFETALELPARLFLSPGQDATWRTPRPTVAREAALSLKRKLSADKIAAAEVWTATLAEVGLPNLKSEEGNRIAGGLRAVWSPDYRAEALLSLDGPGAPPRGPIAPWAIPRSIGTRSGGDADSKAALTALDQRRFRTSLDAYDRHELVALTSAHGLPVLGRRLASGALAPDGGQFDPPPGYRLDGLGADKTPQGDREADFSAIYRPKVLEISELTLSALGANLDLDTAFVPPASARGKDGKNLFDAFAVERWRHRMVLGRDVTVEVVYKGYLFPIGHRASLVKLTERRLEWTAGSAGPVAVLVQRMFLRVGEPEKSFRAYGQPNEGRRWPAERVTLLTRRTPDIVDPSEASLDKRDKVHNSGRYNPPGSTGLMFWPRLSRSDQSEVWFEMLMGRETVPVRLPLMFVDNAAANDPETITKLVDYYNNGETLKPLASAPNVAAAASEQGPSPSRRLMRGAEPTAMAADYKPSDTSFQAGWWDIKAEGRETSAPANETAGFRINNANFVRDAFMEGLDQPPFYPFIDAAKLRLTQIERATAADTEVWGVFGYDGRYAAEGFPKRVEKAPGNGGAGQAPTSEETYLRLREQYLDRAQTALKFSLEKRGEAAGAVGQPNQDIVGISRQHGLVANSSAVALGNPGAAPKAKAGDEASPPTPSLPRPDPGNSKDFLANMFPSNAKLLGLMELKDLLLGAADLMAKQPVLQEALDYGAGGVAGGLAEVRAVLISTIIEPGLQLVDKVREEWKDVSRRKVALLGSGTGALPTLSQAYPELDVDLEQLKNGLSSARDGSVSDTAFFAGLATLHETGRRLIRTIARIAHDPFAAAANDGDIDAIKKIIEILRDPAALLKDAREQLASEIATVATLVSGRVDRYLVLDIVLQQGFLDGASAADIRAALSAFQGATRAAIAQAVSDTATKVIGEGKDLVATKSELAAFLTAAITNAESKVQAEKVAVRKAVVGALSSLATRLAQTPDRTLDLLSTPELDKFLKLASALSEARIALKERPEPKTLFSAVGTVARALFVVLDLPPVEVPAAPDPICRKALEVVSAAIALLPPEDAVATARKEIVATAGAPLTKLQAACAAIGLDISPLRGRLLAFGNALAALQAGSAETPELAVAPGADACAVLSGGSARWLRAVTVQRGHATTALNETVAAAVTLFDQITKITDPTAKSTAISALRELAVPLANQARNLLTTTAAAAVKTRIDALSAAIKAIEADAWLKVVAAELIKAIDGAFLNGFAQAMMRGEAAAKSVADTKADEDVDTLRHRLGELDEAAKAVLKVVKDFDVALASATERVVAAADKALDAALAPVATKFIELLRPISKLYDDAAKQVAGLDEKLAGEASGSDATKKFISLLLDAFARALGVERLLKVDFKDREGKDGVDRFSYEAKLLLEAVADAPGVSAQARLRRMEQAVRFAFPYDGVTPAPVQLLDRALHVDGQILKTVAIQALNLEGLRRELEALVRELVPVKAQLSYDFSSAVGPLEGIFMPAAGTELVLASRTEVDLLRPAKPVIDVDGSLGPFAIKLFGPFHAVTLHFLGVDYRSRNGGGNLQVRFGEVEVGAHAKFLEQLQSYLSPGEGAGFRLVPLSNRPGLEAGYGVNLGTFGVGTLSFSNVSLNAAARLPFDNSSAEFAISVGRSDAPFLISSTIFGGGGYLQLTATAKGIVGLEASFNYGGVFAFGFGPLVGQGQLTLGCYINKRKGQDIELGMVFQISGSAKIACFGVMASLYVRLTMQKGSMRGTAVFTYSFKLAIKDLTFRIRVSRNEGGSLGGGDGANQSGGERKTTAKPYAEKQATLDRWPVPSLDVETAYASVVRSAELKLAPNMPDATSLSASRAYFDPAPLPQPYL